MTVGFRVFAVVRERTFFWVCVLHSQDRHLGVGLPSHAVSACLLRFICERQNKRLSGRASPAQLGLQVVVGTEPGTSGASGVHVGAVTLAYFPGPGGGSFSSLRHPWAGPVHLPTIRAHSHRHVSSLIHFSLIVSGAPLLQANFSETEAVRLGIWGFPPCGHCEWCCPVLPSAVTQGCESRLHFSESLLKTLRFGGGCVCAQGGCRCPGETAPLTQGPTNQSLGARYVFFQSSLLGDNGLNRRMQ